MAADMQNPDQQSLLYEALQRWNPWWAGANFDAGVPRSALEEVKLWLAQPQVLAICGMRRCGKSTLMLQVIKELLEQGIARPNEILLVNLEEPIFLELLEKGKETQVLESVLQVYRQQLGPTGKPWLFLDEVQSIAGWAGWARSALETGRGHVMVSGSSSRLVETDIAQVLTGRCITRTLWPLSFSEFIRFRHDRPGAPLPAAAQARMLDDYLYDGGMPEAILDRDEHRRQERLKQYFRDILHRDVVGRHQVRSVRALEEVAHHYLVNTARESSFNSVKNKYGLAMDQVRAYTDHLEECYLIGTTPRFSFKASIQARSPKKIFARDVGLRNAVSFRFSPNRGPLAETVVFNHLSLDPEIRIIYYRDTAKKAECDFILWANEAPINAIQVCYTTSEALPEREVRGLVMAMEALDLQEGLLLTCASESKETEVCGRRILRVPIWQWLQEQGWARTW